MRKLISTLIISVVALAVPTAASAAKYALILGNNYKGSSPVSDLELAEPDARLMKKQIVKTGNFKAKNVRVFLGKDVNRANLKKQLVGWLGKVVKKDDQVFFYFAGHGAFQRDPKAKNGMRNTVIMYTKPHVTDDELNQWMAKIRTKKAIIILDCCFSGGIAKKGAKVRGNSNIPIPEGKDSVVLQDLDDVYFKDKVVVASADANETAIEIGAPINHGVFTYYFSKAILKADLNKDKMVTAYEAFFKARNDTVKLAKRAKHKQVPQISGNASGFIFKGKPKAKPNPVDDDDILPPIDGGGGTTTTQPPIDLTEPVNITNKLKGKLILDTTYRKDLTGSRGPDVYVGAKKVSTRVKWLSDENWGRVAYINVGRIPSGVHNITVKSKAYPDRIVKTGIEPNKPTIERIVIAKKGRGAIQGNVWVGNFTQPFPKLKIFLSPIRIPKQPKVRSRKDGSFAFQELKPGRYRVFVVGGIGFFTKPYNAFVDVRENDVSTLEIVLKESFKKK